jgi:colicin import membrane protein
MRINFIISIAIIFYSAYIHAGEAALIIDQKKSNIEKTNTEKIDRSKTADPEYHLKVINAISRNLMMPRSASGNHETEVMVTTSEEGRVLSRSIIQSSGNVEWNDIVIRAIDRTGTFPKDTHGIVPSPMILVFNSNM